MKKKDNLPDRMSMVKILEHCFYHAPQEFSMFANSVGIRVSATAFSPIVINLVSLYREAPTEELEKEILRHIDLLSKKYDEL